MALRVSIPFVLLLGAALGLAPGAAAQEITSPYRFVDTRQSLGPYGGYLITDPGDLELGPESGPIGGLRYTIRVSGPFVVEAGIGYFPSTRPVLDTMVVAPDSVVPVRDGTADVKLLLLDAGLRFNITGPRTFHGLLPYLLFGGGLAIDLAGASAAPAEGVPPMEGEIPTSPGTEFDFGTSFAGQVGVGVEWFVTRRVTLGLDARDVLWQIPTPEAFLRPEIGVAEEQWVQNFLLSAAVTYRF